MRLFLLTIMNGFTLAALYFLVASGFTLVFGLMRNVNLAHGSLYLLGAYIGYDAADLTGSWFVGVAAGFLSMAAAGLLLQIGIFRRMEGQELRQTLVTIGISIVLADLMLAIWGGKTYQFEPPDWLYGAIRLPLVRAYPIYRLALLGTAIVIGIALWLFLNRTRVGHDDPRRGRRPGHAPGLRRQYPAHLRHHLRAGRRACRLCRRGGRHGALHRARARTCAISWPRWWWSSSAAWAA